MVAKKAKPNAFLSGGKGKRPPKPNLIKGTELKNDQDQPPYIIKGRVADSKDEYWASLALIRIEKTAGYGWAYQYTVYGGRSGQGKNRVDFLVFTPGRWTIIEPMGRIWHTGRNEDRYQMEEVARRNNWNLIAYFTDEPKVATKELVYSFLKSELHV